MGLLRVLSSGAVGLQAILYCVTFGTPSFKSAETELDESLHHSLVVSTPLTQPETALSRFATCGESGGAQWLQLKHARVRYNRRCNSPFPLLAGLGLSRHNLSLDVKQDLWASDDVQRVRRPLLRRSSDRPSPTPELLKSVSLVDEDGKLEGVIQVQRDELPQPTWGRIYALAGGDVVFLLLFAAVGRLSHGLPSLDWDTVSTADPFIAGWLIGSYFTGGYGPEGQGLKGLKLASLAAVKSWAVGIPLSLAIRGFMMGHIPATPFIVVSLASTCILQVGWRTAFTALFPNDEKSFQKKMADRKGGIFEFFELLTSLVKRW